MLNFQKLLLERINRIKEWQRMASRPPYATVGSMDKGGPAAATALVWEGRGGPYAAVGAYGRPNALSKPPQAPKPSRGKAGRNKGRLE